MKLLIKQYLTSLNERDELDVVLPDILSEVGFTIISRPKRGTRQYGVDVAAIGPHPETGEKSLFLLSIKSGDLRRADWDVGQQALRPSLNEILDVYIPKHIAKRYKSLPVVIALCFGGDIQEDIRVSVDSYTDEHAILGKIEFVEWNGDYIATLIASGLLREKIFPKSVQSSFRKAVAFVDEPSICAAHFEAVISELGNQKFSKKSDRLTAARQIYLAVWTVFVWCRDVENLEAAYRCSALATLWTWDLCHSQIGIKSRLAKGMTTAIDKTVALYRLIGAAFIEKHIVPYGEVEDGLAISIRSSESLDINLKLFEALGRVALHGLWLIHYKARILDTDDEDLKSNLEIEIEKVTELLCNMINNNPALFTPIRDDHAIEITLTGLFLMQCEEFDFLANWIDQITLSSIFAHRRGQEYPCIYREYADLAAHPQSKDDYQQDATIGSILYPTLGVWLAALRNTNSFNYLAKFHKDDMAHSTWQFWLPDSITDEHFYKNSKVHGACFSDMNTQDGSEAYIKQVQDEVTASSAFDNLSAMRFGVWPLILLACHTHRLPVPPHFWFLELLPQRERGQSLENNSQQIQQPT